MKKLILSFLGVLVCTMLFARANNSLQDSAVMNDLRQTLGTENNVSYEITDPLEKILEEKREESYVPHNNQPEPGEAVEAGQQNNPDIEIIKKNAALFSKILHEKAYIHREGSNGYGYADNGFEVIAAELFYLGVKDFEILPESFSNRCLPWKTDIPGKKDKLWLMRTILTIKDKAHGKIELTIRHGIEYNDNGKVWGGPPPGSGRVYYKNMEIKFLK